MAPVQRRAQRLMARGRGARAADQEGEDVVQPLGQLGRGQDPHPRRGQLDGQRQAVEPLADGGHLSGVLVGDLERRPDQLRPLLEQLDRVRGGQGRRGQAGARASLGQRERRYLPVELALHAQSLAAGGQHGQRRAGGQQALGQAGRRSGQVLAVVQHDQHLMVADVLGHRLGRVLPGGIGHAQPAGQGLPDDPGVLDLGQLYPAHPGREGLAGRSRGGQGQPRLARAARAGEGEQAGAGHRLHDVVELALTTHQRGEPHRELRCDQRHAASVPRFVTGNALYNEI